MSIASEITRINNNISAAYTACNGKGATMPATQNSANLADCIDSISGGGGASGYTLTLKYQFSNGAYMSLTLNGDTTTSSLHDGWNTMAVYSVVKIPNITSVSVNGDSDYYWDCITELTMGGSTRSLNFGETVTLTGDATLKLYEASCLLKGTLITMADGSYKEISEVQVGDKIFCVNSEGLSDEDTVTYSDYGTKKFNDNYDLWEFENDIEVRTTHHHRFYNVERQAMVYLDEFIIGEHTIDIDGNQVALLKHTNMTKRVHHFTLKTEKYNNYFANGILSGNRYSTELHLGTIEQRQVESNPSKNIGEFIND